MGSTTGAVTSSVCGSHKSVLVLVIRTSFVWLVIIIVVIVAMITE